jgi:IS30 family transposase
MKSREYFYWKLQDRQNLEQSLLKGYPKTLCATKCGRSKDAIYQEIRRFRRMFPGESYNAVKAQEATVTNIYKPKHVTYGKGPIELQSMLERIENLELQIGILIDLFKESK